MIEIYAITADPAPQLADELPELQAVTSCGLAALCAPAREEPPSPADLWAREDVLEKLMEQGDLLPVRYGTRVADEAAAARALEERQEQLNAALERVRGAVELALRVHRAPDAERRPTPTDGAAYLQARAETLGERAFVARFVHEPLAALSRAASRRTIPPSGHEILRSAYLVDRALVDRFAERLTELEAKYPEWRLLCTGPWPPYSFVER